MLEPGRNLALLLDKYLMGNWQDGTNYAWILAQFGFGAMTMLGLLGGQMLKRVQGHGKSWRGCWARARAAWRWGMSGAWISR